MNRAFRRLRMSVAVTLAALSIAAPGAGAVPTRLDAYRYPVVPGTAAWAALGDHAKMLDATQVPAHVTAAMPTGALVATVLDYPLYLDYLAFTTAQQGFDIMASRFDAMGALYARRDAGTEVLRRYLALDLKVPAATAAAGDKVLEVRKVEMLLGQPQILATLSKAQLDTVLRRGLQVINAKRNAEWAYGLAGLEPTAMLLGRALTAGRGVTFPGNELVKTGTESSLASVRNIVFRVVTSLSVPFDPMTTVSDDYPTTVSTPRGTTVNVTERTTELTAAEISSINAQVDAAYPGAIREANASRRYNCHSWAWYWQSTSNTKWMEGGEANKYITDGSYRAYNSSTDPYWNGMRWRYNTDHSAIEDLSRGYYWVRGKWGTAGRYYHYWSNSPYYPGSIARYHNFAMVLP